MLTPEEIKKISEQYAEFTDGSPADKAYIRAITQCFTEYLSKDYCIVPKVQAKMAHKMEMQAYESTNKPAAHIFKQRALLIEALFGTELFNEEKG